MTNPTSLRIQLYKFPRTPHYYWWTHRVHETEKGLICHSRAPRSLVHQTKGQEFVFESDVLEFYWKQLPFSLHCALFRETNRLHYYSNIHSLPEIGAERMEMVDFDLDVVRDDVAPAQIVDEDEFVKHTREFGYSPAVQTAVPAIAAFVQELLNGSDLFSKDTMLALLDSVDAGNADLSRWTESNEVLQVPAMPSVVTD